MYIFAMIRSGIKVCQFIFVKTLEKGEIKKRAS